MEDEMMPARTILFVSASSGDALRAAKKLGLRVIMITEAELTWQRQYIDEVIAVNPYDSRIMLEAIMNSGLNSSINGVMTFDERAVPVVAKLAEMLDLPGNSYEAAYAARNKFVMRRRFSESGLAGPRFGIAKTPAEAEKLGRSTIGFPLVIKPLFGSASQGVIRVDGPEQLREAYPIVKRISESHRTFLPDDEYGDYLLLEEYLSGREVAVDALLIHGEAHLIGIFDKPNPLEGPTFEETIYLTPSNEEDALQAEIFNEVVRGARALGLTTGPLHAEVRITSDGLRVIEIGARAIGGVCGRAHTYCLGFDYNEMFLRTAVGEAVELPSGERTPSGVMMLPVPTTGRLIRVGGVEEAGRVTGVRDVFIMSKPGDIIQAFPQQGCYLGFILATGSSTGEVEQRLNESHALLHFEIEALKSETGSR